MLVLLALLLVLLFAGLGFAVHLLWIAAVICSSPGWSEWAWGEARQPGGTTSTDGKRPLGSVSDPASLPVACSALVRRVREVVKYPISEASCRRSQPRPVESRLSDD